MPDHYSSLPVQIQNHIDKIIKVNQLQADESTKELLAEDWIKKEKVFHQELKKKGFIEVEYLEEQDERGAVLLTYSGSIIDISTLHNGKRNIVYHSINLRNDVPETIKLNNVSLAYDIIKDEPLDLKDTKIKKTSNIYAIGTLDKNEDFTEQDNTLNEMSLILINSFAEMSQDQD